MSYLHSTSTDPMSAKQQPPFGPGFTDEEIARSVKMEVWCSSFSDPGPDWTVFKLIAADGRIVGTKLVEGY